MNLTRSQKIMLETISNHDGEINWYQLSAACFSELESPADFELKTIREAGYIESRSVEGEPLNRLHITALGREALAKYETEQV